MVKEECSRQTDVFIKDEYYCGTMDVRTNTILTEICSRNSMFLCVLNKVNTQRK